jgi:hypothetical protein
MSGASAALTNSVPTSTARKAGVTITACHGARPPCRGAAQAPTAPTVVTDDQRTARRPRRTGLVLSAASRPESSAATSRRVARRAGSNAAPPPSPIPRTRPVIRLLNEMWVESGAPAMDSVKLDRLATMGRATTTPPRLPSRPPIAPSTTISTTVVPTTVRGRPPNEPRTASSRRRDSKDMAAVLATSTAPIPSAKIPISE